MAQAAGMDPLAVPCPSVARPIEVLLVDDQRAILAGATALISSESPAMRVTGHASTSCRALDLAGSIQPDVIVLDVELGGEDGLELIRELSAGCKARIIVFTCDTTPDIRARALHLGARAVVSKAAPGGELLAAIRAAAPFPD